MNGANDKLEELKMEAKLANFKNENMVNNFEQNFNPNFNANQTTNFNSTQNNLNNENLLDPALQYQNTNTINNSSFDQNQANFLLNNEYVPLDSVVAPSINETLLENSGDIKSGWQKNQNLGKILTIISGAVLVLSLLTFFITLLPKLTQKKPVQTNLVSNSFLVCKNAGGEISKIGAVDVCQKDGVFYSQNYTKKDYNELLNLEEKTAAEEGKIIYSSSNSKDLQKFVVGSYYKTNAVPKGVVAYISNKPELTAVQIINNIFLNKQDDGQQDNDVFVDNVKQFLDKNPQYTEAEPLGEESAVLKAFDVHEQRTKSRTIGEINDLSASGLEKIRAVYGVDGAEQDKRAVTVRVFGQVRNNVILLQNNISQEIQNRLENEYLSACRSQSQFKTDVQNCYFEKLKSDQNLLAEVQKVAVEIIEQFNLK